RRRGSAVDAHAQHAGPGDLRRQERGDGLVGLRADQLLSAGGVDRGGVVPATVGRRRARAGPAGRGGRRIGAGGEEADGKHQPGRGDSAARGPETSGGESAGHEGSSEVGGTGESVGASGRTRWRKERVRSWAGWSMTWAGGPCSTIRPWSMNTTVSATSRAKEISCVTITSVVPALASERITARTSATSSGSSALVGSSNRSTLGRRARARAIATRCCCPPESWRG